MENETLDTLKVYSLLADQLVALASKEQLGECARVLALNVAHYASRYGELPLEDRCEEIPKRFKSSYALSPWKNSARWRIRKCGYLKWITREKVRVNRTATAWLIRRFIDLSAELIFVPAEQVAQV